MELFFFIGYVMLLLSCYKIGLFCRTTLLAPLPCSMALLGMSGF